MLESTYLETADIETSSEDYARRFAGRVGSWFLQVQENSTLDLLAPFPGAAVLDVGGGHGQVAGALAGCGYTVTVLGSAESCRNRIEPLVRGGRLDFQVGDILDLPYPDRSFDVVLTYRLLPHVTRWEQFIAGLARVARQVVILDYPEVRSVNSVAPFLFRFKKRLEGNTRPYTSFREAEVTGAFRRHGFERTGRQAEFFFPMVLHRKLNRPSISAASEALARRTGLTVRFGSPVILRLERKASG